MISNDDERKKEILDKNHDSKIYKVGKGDDETTIADWNNKKKMRTKLGSSHLKTAISFIDGLGKGENYGSISEDLKKDILEIVYMVVNTTHKQFGIPLSVDTNDIIINDKEYEFKLYTEKEGSSDEYNSKVLKGKIKNDLTKSNTECIEKIDEIVE